MNGNSEDGILIETLIATIATIEKNLNKIRIANAETQEAGQALSSKIKGIRQEGKEVPEFLNYDMNSVTCLREWQFNYIERFEQFIFETKKIYVEWSNLQGKSGFLINSKLKKIYRDAGNFIELGRMYLQSFDNVFDGDFGKLLPGEDIRKEALTLMSKRMQANNAARR